MLAGLRDLVDFLPASLAAITGYFSSEVTRGVWKQVPMNGVDWPSPAAILQSVESEIKAILAAVGVDVPNCSTGTHAVNYYSILYLFVTDFSVEFNKIIAYIYMHTCRPLSFPPFFF